MTEEAAVIEADKEVTAKADDGTGKEPDKKATETANEDQQKQADKAADKSTADDADKSGEADKAKASDEDGPKIPDNWRELASNGDEDALKLLKRYGSMNGVVKALIEKERLIRSGKIKRDMPDPTDEKAMAEWRKEQGVPDDPSGYKLPDTVIKRMSDEDKPMLASFTDYAHKAGAPQAVVDIASEWYFNMAEEAATKQAEEDASALDEAETALRKDWAPGEFKPNMTLAKRFISDIPGVGEDWSEARLPNGRRLGDLPEFIQWASDQGRQKFGDVTFATADGDRKHTARKDEIEKIMKTDMNRYWAEGLDKEMIEIQQREDKRRK